MICVPPPARASAALQERTLVLFDLASDIAKLFMRLDKLIVHRFRPLSQ